MKKPIAVFATIAASVFAISFAQDTTTSGSFNTEVNKSCVVQMPLDSSTTLTQTNEVEPSPFIDTLAANDTFSFESNTNCAANVAVDTNNSQVEEQPNGGDKFGCFFDNAYTATGPRTIGSSDPATTQTVYAYFRDNDGKLAAGNYNIVCKVSLTF